MTQKRNWRASGAEQLSAWCWRLVGLIWRVQSRLDVYALRHRQPECFEPLPEWKERAQRWSELDGAQQDEVWRAIRGDL